MYSNMGEHIAVVNGVDGYSPATSMDGANAVQVTAVVANNTATSLTVEVQGSSDLNNWTVITTNTGLGLGYNAPAKSTGIGWAYVRLRYSVVGTGVIVFAAGINTSNQ